MGVMMLIAFSTVVFSYVEPARDAIWTTRVTVPSAGGAGDGGEERQFQRRRRRDVGPAHGRARGSQDRELKGEGLRRRDRHRVLRRDRGGDGRPARTAGGLGP